MEPELTPTTEALYGDMPEIMRLADKKNDYALKQYLAGAGDVLDIIQALAERIEYLAIEDRDPDRPARKRRNWIPLSTFGWNGEPHKSTSFMKTGEEVLTSLATNPSFETTSGTVEAWRNLIWNPFNSASGWSPAGFDTGSVSFAGGVFTGTQNANLSVNNAVAPNPTWTTSPEFVGAPMSSGYVVESAQTIEGRIAQYSGVTYVYGPTITIPAGVPTRVFVEGLTNVDGTYSQPRLHLSAIVGNVVKVSEPISVAGTFLPDFFSATYSPDPELTPSWTGEANNSPSALRANLMAGVSGGSERLNIQSGPVGERLLRILRLTGSSIQSSYGARVFSEPAELVGKTFTVIAKCIIPEGYDPSSDVITGMGSRSRTIFGFQDTVNNSGPAPAVPGVYELKLVYPPSAATRHVQLGGGGTVGQSIYWDDLTIVEGNHPDLVPFSGDTPTLYGEDDVLHDVSDLFDGRYAETAWLPWISQILGTSSTNAMTSLETRETILNSTAGLYSGTERSIIQSVKAVLTGNKNVAIRRNRTATGVGGIWDLLIITVESETPIGFDFQKYLIEQGVKPAGVVIWNSTYNATWETLNTERPTWGDWTNNTWQEIMETGI